MIYESLCLEQAEIITTLHSQVCRLIAIVRQYTDIEEEEKKLEEVEKRIAQ